MSWADLARTRVFGDSLLAPTHFRTAFSSRLVDRGDLVRQRVDQRRVDREHRIEEVRETDPVRLGREPEVGAAAVKTPRAPRLDEREAVLVGAVEHFLATGDPTVDS
jgi:hypothetical protein